MVHTSVPTRWVRLLLIAALMAPGAGLMLAAEAQSEPAAEHGLSQKAVEIASLFGFPVTNSMVVTWIVALGLIIFAQVATREMKQVPGGAQNFFEWLVESLYGFLEGIIGPHLVKRTFWFFATTFIFILTANWVGLIPGVGTIGWGHATSHGFKIDQPLFRGANADVNLTLAMALIFFALLDCLGPSGSRPGRVSKGTVCAQGREQRPVEGAPRGRVLRGRLFGNDFNLVPAGLSEFSSLRQHLCR